MKFPFAQFPLALIFFTKSGFSRSSRPDVFCKKGVLRNFAKFTGKHLCQSLYFNKVAGLGLAQVFSCEFCEFSRNNFSYRIPLVVAFVLNPGEILN